MTEFQINQRYKSLLWDIDYWKYEIEKSKKSGYGYMKKDVPEIKEKLSTSQEQLRVFVAANAEMLI